MPSLLAVGGVTVMVAARSPAEESVVAVVVVVAGCGSLIAVVASACTSVLTSVSALRGLVAEGPSSTASNIPTPAAVVVVVVVLLSVASCASPLPSPTASVFVSSETPTATSADESLLVVLSSALVVAAVVVCSLVVAVCTAAAFGFSTFASVEISDCVAARRSCAGGAPGCTFLTELVFTGTFFTEFVFTFALGPAAAVVAGEPARTRDCVCDCVDALAGDDARADGDVCGDAAIDAAAWNACVALRTREAEPVLPVVVLVLGDATRCAGC